MKTDYPMEANVIGRPRTERDASNVPSAFHATQLVLSNARDLAGRVERLADQLLGPVLAAVCESHETKRAEGLFGELAEDVRITQRWLDDANRALNRIEGAL